MKHILLIYFRALGIYALFTCPLLAEPSIYLMSLTLAFLFGWFSLAIFTFLFLPVMKSTTSSAIRLIAAFASVPVAVASGLHLMQVFGLFADVWNEGEFLGFPLIAVVAGWISVCLAKQVVPVDTPLVNSQTSVNE